VPYGRFPRRYYLNYPVFLQDSDKLVYCSGGYLKPSLSSYNLNKSNLSPDKSVSLSYLDKGKVLIQVSLPQNKVATVFRKEYEKITELAKTLICSSIYMLVISNENLLPISYCYLKSESTFDLTNYDEIIIIDESYLALKGSSMRNIDKDLIQIYNISNQKIKLEKQLFLEKDSSVVAMPGGRIASCSESGHVIFHSVLPRMEHKNEEVVSIASDYAGFFRQKTEKEEKQSGYVERRHFDNPDGGCVIS